MTLVTKNMSPIICCLAEGVINMERLECGLKIGMIASLDSYNYIGLDNHLLFKFKEDMSHFVESTTNQIVLMGRKTFESLGSKPLKNRMNIVMTSKETTDFLMQDKEYKNLFYARDFDVLKYDALGMEEVIAVHTEDFHWNTPEKIYIIGGGQIYESALKELPVEFLDLTMIYASYENISGIKPNIKFPPISLTEWENKTSIDNSKNSKEVISARDWRSLTLNGEYIIHPETELLYRFVLYEKI